MFRPKEQRPIQVSKYMAMRASSAQEAEFVRETTVLEGMPILFPILNTMINNGTFPAESTHSRRIRACKNENNASPRLSIRCTNEQNDILGGRNILEIRMESDQFILDAIDARWCD